MTLATLLEPGDDLLDAYVVHCEQLVVQPSYRRLLVRAAESFLAVHPDLDEWMARPVDARLVELSRRQGSWPFVFFALLSGRGRGDLDFLIAKKFGHTAARTTTILYPSDIARLGESASRIGCSDTAFNQLVGGEIPLAIAGFGVPVSQLAVGDLDALVEFTQTTPRLTATMRRSRRAHLFRLRQLLFQARMIDAPPPHRREGGPATRAGRMAAVRAPEVRRSILAYLDTRAAVVRPKTIDKLTSALAIFGEFICEEFPDLTSLSQLERHHVEAFLTWTSTRECRRPQDGSRQVGPFVAAHATFTLRNFLDDIGAWGWAEAPQRRLVFATDIPRQPEMLPRALPPDVDAAVMGAVAMLSDTFARVGITILRHTGLRMGELLDLELDCLMDYGPERDLVAGPARQAQRRAARPSRRRCPRSVRRVAGRSHVSALPAAPAGRPVVRLRLHRTRPAHRTGSDPARPRPGGGGRRPPRHGWPAIAGSGTPAPPHVGDGTGERRDVTPGAHGVTRSSDPRDDDPLRPAGIAHVAGGIRRGGGQGGATDPGCSGRAPGHPGSRGLAVS